MKYKTESDKNVGFYLDSINGQLRVCSNETSFSKDNAIEFAKKESLIHKEPIYLKIENKEFLFKDGDYLMEIDN